MNLTTIIENIYVDSYRKENTLPLTQDHKMLVVNSDTVSLTFLLASYVLYLVRCSYMCTQNYLLSEYSIAIDRYLASQLDSFYLNY